LADEACNAIVRSVALTFGSAKPVCATAVGSFDCPHALAAASVSHMATVVRMPNYRMPGCQQRGVILVVEGMGRRGQGLRGSASTAPKYNAPGNSWPRCDRGRSDALPEALTRLRQGTRLALTRLERGTLMKKASLLLAPVLGSVALVACTSTTSSPVVVCGPDNVAVTNAEVVAAANYEAAWYYGALDPVPLGFYTVADVSVGGDPDPSYAPTGSGPPSQSPPGSATPIVDAGGPVAPVADAGVGASSAAAASAVAASVGHYYPNGCATATASGNVVTFKLNNCTGPLGLVGSSGTVTATLNLATSGTLTATASGQKTLQANSQTSGTGPGGNDIMHTGMYTLVWPTGTGCATLNGTLSGIGSGTYAGTSTTITNYVACANKCPQSGMTVSSFNGGNVTLSFNGSTSAQCTSSIGTSASIPLNCP
jgi:hypothetical protein